MTQSECIAKLKTVRKKIPLTPVQQLLFHELVYICYLKRWPQQFSYPARWLCNNMGISKGTLIKARKQLIEADLITFTITQNGTSGYYSLLPGEEEENKDKSGTNTEAENCTPTGSIIDPYNKNIKYNTKNNNISKEKNTREEDRKTLFEEFRRDYPGYKRGLETEYQNLKKKHKDYRKIIPLLLPAICNQTGWKQRQRNLGEFTPPWPNLQTWINNRRWEEEPPQMNYD